VADIHEEAMNSSVKKRSIVIGSHKTSISLEDDFWACLRQIARERATTASELIGMLDAARNGGNLSSTIRVFVLDHYRNNVASTVLRNHAGLSGRLSDRNAEPSLS
jgi:predicted DNA-binding ribbon-helix-helix protein